jgi:NADPH-dependent glutamate synthase beta subunit-like oxidoreductase
MAVYDLNRIRVPEAPPEYEDHTPDVHYVPAPCQVACPIGTDAPSYIAYIWEDKYEEAFEAITATNPFSAICGRVCDAPCEPACRRVDSDGPLQIRNLKRFVMDKLGPTYRPPPAPVTQAQSVAVVGSGPAGLTAAHDLCVAGYRVHVYEMSDRLGGMMVWGIPAFRLPPGVIQQDIDRLMQRCPGLEVHLNTALGRDVDLDELKTRHDAVLLTIGSWWGKPMGIPGEADERVVDGVGFLRRINGGERPELPETVVVVGGGDVAMDACRAANRSRWFTAAAPRKSPRDPSSSKAPSPRASNSCTSPSRSRWSPKTARWSSSACAPSPASPTPTAAGGRCRWRAANTTYPAAW